MANEYPLLKNVPGFSWLGLSLGIKDETLDFGVISSDCKCSAAGVFTRSNIQGAPVIIGREHIKDGQFFQYVVPAGTWFSSEVEDKNSFSFCGCTVSPGFDFRDFEMPKRKKLLSKFPNQQKKFILLSLLLILQDWSKGLQREKVWEINFYHT